MKDLQTRTPGVHVAWATAIFMAVTLPLAGCFGTAQGTVQICLKDQAMDEFSAFYVTIGRVEVHRSGSGGAEEDATTATEANGTTSAANTTETGLPATETNVTEPATEPNVNETNGTGPGSEEDTSTQEAEPLGRIVCIVPTFEGGAGTVNETGNASSNETAGPPGGTFSQSVGPTDTGPAEDTNATDFNESQVFTPPGNESEAAEDSRAGWFVVSEGNFTIDLMDFQGDVAALLDEAEVPEGTYTQIRLNIDAAWGVTPSGEVVEATVPSGVVKVVQPWTVRSDTDLQLIVDFDLNGSLRETGNGEWVFQPAWKLIVQESPDAGATDTMNTGAPTTEPVASTNETVGTNATMPTDTAGPTTGANETSPSPPY